MAPVNQSLGQPRALVFVRVGQTMPSRDELLKRLFGKSPHLHSNEDYLTEDFVSFARFWFENTVTSVAALLTVCPMYYSIVSTLLFRRSPLSRRQLTPVLSKVENWQQESLTFQAKCNAWQTEKIFCFSFFFLWYEYSCTPYPYNTLYRVNIFYALYAIRNEHFRGTLNRNRWRFRYIHFASLQNKSV